MPDKFEVHEITNTLSLRFHSRKINSQSNYKTARRYELWCIGDTLQ